MKTKIKPTALITYRWTGISPQGEKTQGEIQASHRVLAKNQLLTQGIIQPQLTRKRSVIYHNSRIKPSEVALFSRQMATLINAGVPLIRACDIIAQAHTQPAFCQIINQIKQAIESGLTFSESLSKHPALFNALMCTLVAAGEQSGSLDILLDQIATYQEKMLSLKQKLKKAATYPILVFAFSLVITAALFIFVVPQFQALFIGFGAELPPATQAMIRISVFFQEKWLLFLGGLTTLGIAFHAVLKHSERFAYLVDRALLSLPLVGPLIKHTVIARFSRTLAITYAAGLSLIDSLETVAGASGNRVFSQAITTIHTTVSTGHSLQYALSLSSVFPNRVTQMIAVGEDSGKLDSMLIKLADFYDAEVDYTLDKLSSLLEPIIMVILGVLIGGLLIAMYLPIFKLGSVL